MVRGGSFARAASVEGNGGSAIGQSVSKNVVGRPISGLVVRAPFEERGKSPRDCRPDFDRGRMLRPNRDRDFPGDLILRWLINPSASC